MDHKMLWRKLNGSMNIFIRTRLSDKQILKQGVDELFGLYLDFLYCSNDGRYHYYDRSDKRYILLLQDDIDKLKVYFSERIERKRKKLLPKPVIKEFSTGEAALLFDDMVDLLQKIRSDSERLIENYRGLLLSKKKQKEISQNVSNLNFELFKDHVFTHNVSFENFKFIEFKLNFDSKYGFLGNIILLEKITTKTV